MKLKKKYVTLEDILEIENDKLLIEQKCRETNITIWPLIRFDFFNHIISSIYYRDNLQIRKPFGLKNFDLIRKIGYSVLHNAFSPVPKNTLIQIHSTGEGNYQNGDSLDDRLVGDLSRATLPPATVYQEAPKSRLIEKRDFALIKYGAPKRISDHLLSKFITSSDHRNLADRVVDQAIENARSKLSFEFNLVSAKRLKGTLAERLSLLPRNIQAWESWFKTTSPKILIKENASYGGNAIAPIIAAKRVGILTGEFQHGLISTGHCAYNVGESLRLDSGFRETLPEYLLTYGKWWSSQTNLPLKAIEIGNPHRSEILRQFTNKSSTRRNILILSDGIEIHKYIEFAADIYQSSKDLNLEVLIRPHPRERLHISEENLPEGIHLDTSDTVYEAFLGAEILVSELSTALFEAIGQVPKIFIWQTPKSNFVIPEGPFENFKTRDDFFQLLKSTRVNRENDSALLSKGYWEEDWKRNYDEFIQGALNTCDVRP